jgi:hypothetical protein
VNFFLSFVQWKRDKTLLPYFLPELSESSKTDWIFMGSPGYGAQLHVSIGGNKLSLYSNVLSLFHNYDAIFSLNDVLSLLHNITATETFECQNDIIKATNRELRFSVAFKIRSVVLSSVVQNIV